MIFFSREAIKQLHTSVKSDQYDKTNPAHEEALMRLWSVSFPNAKLESRYVLSVL